MRTRHLVGLISGVLILSVLLPVGLSIWLAHQQVETSFIEELDTYSSRVAIRANKVATQGKDALQELERWQGAACSEAWICPYISRHLLSLNPLLACCRRYSR
ncbi:CSS-motif domain-containing protein, partial [Escherichia coli]|nr:CSS-motif domain-containing protein [Escherichia coli]